MDPEDEEVVPPESTCCGHVMNRISFFCSQSWKETKLRTCSFIWGFLSVMIVCAMTSLVYSVTTKFPVVVLMLSESSAAELDLIITPGDWNDQFTLNSTYINEVMTTMGSDYSRMSPRVNSTVLAENPSNGKTFYSTFIAMDTDREKDIEVGREWPYDKIEPGKAIITQSLAKQLEIKAGDTITFKLDLRKWTSIPVTVVKKEKEALLAHAMDLLEEVPVSFTVHGIATDAYGKVRDEEVIFVELESVWQHIIKFLPDSLTSEIPLEKFAVHNISHYVTECIFTYTIPRYEAYLTTNQDSISSDIVDWSSVILNSLSFNELNSQTPVASSFSAFSIMGMFINVISLIIIAVLSALSIILIYSLLQISVDTRTLELGILRMIGLNRLGVIGMIVTQSLLYSLPGLVLGIGLGFLANFFVIDLLADSTGVPLDHVMPVASIFIAAAVAVGISLIASVLPIRTALSQNLHDSLDVDHSKNQVIQVTIERADDLQQPIPLLVGGILFAAIGAGVYIVFPLSLLSADVTLLGSMFFIMLLLILGSLVMIALNFEHFFERVFAIVFLFWESRAIRAVALKNLGAHRLRNRKTTLLYSVSLSFLIFSNMLLILLSRMIGTMVYMNHGCDIHVAASGFRSAFTTSFSTSQYDPDKKYMLRPAELQEIVDKYSDIVANVAWGTHELEVVYPMPVRTQIANIGRSHAYYHHIFSLSPNFVDKLDNTYLSATEWKKSGDSVIKQLYTNNGNVFSTSLSNGLKVKMDGKAGDVYLMNIVSQLQFEQEDSSSFLSSAASFLSISLARYNITSSAYIEAIPFLNTPSNTISATDLADLPLSIPSYLSLLPGSLGQFDNIHFNHLFITLVDDPDEDRRDDLYDELKGYQQDPNDDTSTFRVWAYYSALDNMELAMTILNVIMTVVTVVVMLLCFFSLMSSMNTNVLEQAKEVGIMRALGLTRFQMVRVFCEEAFILVITATLMGLACGLIVGYLLTQQFTTLQGLPADLYFPTALFVAMVSVAVVTSIISALSPILTLTSKEIVMIIKTV